MKPALRLPRFAARDLPMTPRLLTALLATGLLSATACAPAAPPPVPRQAPPMSDPLPAMEMTCNPDAAKTDLVGQPANDANIEKARVASGAEVVRVIPPDTMVTMEFNPVRLNVDVDANGVITNLRCG